MTKNVSSLNTLTRQAKYIASMVKGFERGELPKDVQFASRLIEARNKPELKFGIVMDGKTIVISAPWETIRSTTEVGLSAFLLKQMLGKRIATH